MIHGYFLTVSNTNIYTRTFQAIINTTWRSLHKNLKRQRLRLLKTYCWHFAWKSSRKSLYLFSISPHYRWVRLYSLFIDHINNTTTLQAEAFTHHQKTCFVGARLLQYGGSSFYSAAPKLWSELPDSMRKCEFLDVFKSALNKHIFCNAYL